MPQIAIHLLLAIDNELSLQELLALCFQYFIERQQVQYFWINKNSIIICYLTTQIMNKAL